MCDMNAASLRLGYLFVVLLALLVSASGLLSRFEWRWLDTQMAVLAQHSPSPAADPVVVVGIDDASLVEFGVPLATLHRQLGAFFEAMAVAKPRAVGVDVVLPATSYDRIQPGLDAALARGLLALRPVAPLVLGMTANADGSLRPLHPLFATLAGADGNAVVFVSRDGDGVVRRFDERLGRAHEPISTLAGQLARRLGVSTGEGLVPYFRTPPVSYVPLKDVLAWHAAADLARLQHLFGDRVVLLGSLLAHDDQHAVPLPLSRVDTGATTHGVFIHAAQLRALLAQDLIHPLTPPLAIGITLLLTLAWWPQPGRRTWLLAATSIAAGLLAALKFLDSGWAIPIVTWSVVLLLAVSSRTALAAWSAAAERRRLRLAFDGFVSPAVLREILAGRLRPGLQGERRDICVLFSDIRGFTSLSEHMAPEAVTELLNRYFERMARAIHRHGGTLDKFIGDGIMAFFGAPQADPSACMRAFEAAREMLEELAAFNREQAASGGPPVAIGIGLHFGPALIGYIGATSRHEYSAIGDTVNTASRLEGVTKDASCPIVMSPAVRQHLSDADGIVALGEFPLKGRAPMAIYGWKP